MCYQHRLPCVSSPTRGGVAAVMLQAACSRCSALRCKRHLQRCKAHSTGCLWVTWLIQELTAGINHGLSGLSPGVGGCDRLCPACSHCCLAPQPRRSRTGMEPLSAPCRTGAVPRAAAPSHCQHPVLGPGRALYLAWQSSAAETRLGRAAQTAGANGAGLSWPTPRWDENGPEHSEAAASSGRTHGRSISAGRGGRPSYPPDTAGRGTRAHRGDLGRLSSSISSRCAPGLLRSGTRDLRCPKPRSLPCPSLLAARSPAGQAEVHPPGYTLLALPGLWHPAALTERGERERFTPGRAAE